VLRIIIKMIISIFNSMLCIKSATCI